VRTIIQTQSTECALACLAMIASHYGQNWNLIDLRRKFPQSLRGSNLKDLIAFADDLGFSCRAIRLELNELHLLQTPCIVHWDLNHYVVLRSVKGAKILIIDPAFGEKTLSVSEFSEHFTGIAVEFTLQTTFQPKSLPPRIAISQLAGRVQGIWLPVTQILIVAFVLEIFAIAGPLYNQMVVDRVLTSNDSDLLTVLVIGFAFVVIIQAILTAARSWLVLLLGQTISLQWLNNVFSHLLKLPLGWFEQRHLGDITTRFGSIHELQKILTRAVIEGILDGIMAIIALIVMLLYSVELTLIVIGAAVSYGVVRIITFKPLRAAAVERITLHSQEQTHFIETLRAIMPLKLFGRETERRSRWHNLNVEVQNRDVRTAKLEIAFSFGNNLIFSIENLLVIWLGAHMIMSTSQSDLAPFTIGMLLAFLAYKSQFTGRVSALIDHGINLRMLSLHSERLSDIVLHAPENESNSNSSIYNELDHLEPTIELRNVGFRYSERDPWLFRNVNIIIPPGDHIALVGKSGNGKTTLLKVILGLLIPEEGEVLYGGSPIFQLGISNFRKKIGTVMQDDCLLTGSISDNVSFFDLEADQGLIEASCSLANIHTEIMSMPMGYNTHIGDLGAGLSGGQKQRLLLARALYKRPVVLALDEATSHLDVHNERQLSATLSQFNITRIAVAHRPETIASAKRVIVLENGITKSRLSANTEDFTGLDEDPLLNNNNGHSSVT
jgi:ATP-binding cassette subfamily B protein RaxB